MFGRMVAGVVQTVCFCGVASLSFPALARPAEPVSLVNLLGAVEVSLEAANVYDLTYEIETKHYLKSQSAWQAGEIPEIIPQQPPRTLRGRYRLVRQGAREKYEFPPMLTQPDVRSVTIFDGTLVKGWDPEQKTASIRKQSWATVDGVHYHSVTQCVLARWGVVEAIRSQSDAKLEVLEGQSGRGYRVLFEPKAGGKSTGKRYVIDFAPDRDLLPSKICHDQKIADGSFQRFREMEVQEWVAVEGGSWRPSIITTKIYNFYENQKTSGQLWGVTTLRLLLDQCRWGSVEESALQLPLPAGTLVIDEIRQVRYYLGKADPGKNIDDLAANAKDLMPASLGGPRPPRSSFSWWWVILGVFLAVSLAGGSFWWFRRIRSR